MLTAEMFMNDGVDFKMVVESQEAAAYSKIVGEERICILPDSNRGLVFSRNWIKDYSRDQGHLRHWQFDDDIRCMMRLHKGRRIACSSRIALCAAEDFVDRYENIALASFNSHFFVPANRGTIRDLKPPFFLNSRCYTCFLVLNSLPNKWRNRYNEDTDMSLQVIADGWCTILFNAFLINTPTTMTHQGGQTSIYINDGRLKMARQLERVWPGVVTTYRRFQRPQHRVRDAWMKFDTPLKLKKEFDPTKIDPKKYDLDLKVLTPIQNPALQKLKKDIDEARDR